MSTFAQPVPQTSGGGGRTALDWAPAVAVFAIGIALAGLVVAFTSRRSSAEADRDQRCVLDTEAPLEPGPLHLQGSARRLCPRPGLRIVIAFFRLLAAARQHVHALRIAANTIPIIAFAPIMNNWFGLLNPFSKIAIAAVLCFFPVMVNTLRGLTSVHPSSIELMESYAAGRIFSFGGYGSHALPHMFTGLKVATVLSMIGAIVGEYSGGRRTHSA